MLLAVSGMLRFGAKARQTAEQRCLPRCFGYARNFAEQCHFAEFYPADAKLAHIALRAARQQATVVQADRVGVAGQFVERIVIAGFLEFFAKVGIFGYQALALVFAGNDGFLCHIAL